MQSQYSFSTLIRRSYDFCIGKAVVSLKEQRKQATLFFYPSNYHTMKKQLLINVVIATLLLSCTKSSTAPTNSTLNNTPTNTIMHKVTYLFSTSSIDTFQIYYRDTFATETPVARLINSWTKTVYVGVDYIPFHARLWVNTAYGAGNRGCNLSIVVDGDTVSYARNAFINQDVEYYITQ